MSREGEEEAEMRVIYGNLGICSLVNHFNGEEEHTGMGCFEEFVGCSWISAMIVDCFSIYSRKIYMKFN